MVKASLRTVEACLHNKLYDLYLEAELNSGPELLTYKNTQLRSTSWQEAVSWAATKSTLCAYAEGLR